MIPVDIWAGEQFSADFLRIREAMDMPTHCRLREAAEALIHRMSRRTRHTGSAFAG